MFSFTKKLQCPDCTGTYPDVAGFVQHVKTAHPSFSPQFRCGMSGCEEHFVSGSDHISHLRQAHNFSSGTSLGPVAAGPSAPPPSSSGEFDIFISYCKDNSYTAYHNKETSSLSGDKNNDPREISNILAQQFRPWIDHQQLTSGGSTDFYEHKALALEKVKVVVAFISNEYAKDEECRMEYEFALRSLNKPVISVCLGPGWQYTPVGDLVTGSQRLPFDFQHISSERDHNEKMVQLTEVIEKLILEKDTATETVRMNYMTLSPTAPPSASALASSDMPPSYEEFMAKEHALTREYIRKRAPSIGDHVVSHHFKHAYYMATIVSFSKATMSYEIRWDDGDPSGRVQPYNKVALDIVPTEVISVGQTVFFCQGSYGGTDGNNSGGQRYHEGVIDEIKAGSYFGHHLKGERDDKWVTYSGYQYNFICKKESLRIAANPMDALMAFQEL